MAIGNEARESVRARIFYGPKFKAAFGVALENCSRQICEAFSGRPDSLDLENTLRLLKTGCQLLGHLAGIHEGYRAACLISKNKDHANDVARIVRRHPDWSTRQIAKRLDSLDREIPPRLLGQSQIRLWEDALDARHSALSKRIEKHISRLRIAVRLLDQSLVYKKFIKTGLLP